MYILRGKFWGEAHVASGKNWPVLSSWAEEGAKNYGKVKVEEEGEW